MSYTITGTERLLCDLWYWPVSYTITDIDGVSYTIAVTDIVSYTVNDTDQKSLIWGVTADDRNYLIRGLIPNVSLLHDHWRWSEISYTTTDTDDKSYTTTDTDRKSLTRLLILMTSLIRSLTLILSLIPSMILIRSLLYGGVTADDRNYLIRGLILIVSPLHDHWRWSEISYTTTDIDDKSYTTVDTDR